jgi:hypothetical protein
VTSLAAASTLLAGCLCGASAVPTKDDGGGAKVNSDGVVVFDKTEIGDSVTFKVPLHDTADVDETLMGATIGGADADSFELHARFPIDMAAGSVVHLEVEFHPTHAGKLDAELMVQTKEMGVSPIEMTGSAD